MKMATRTVEIVLLVAAFAALATARPQGFQLEKTVQASGGGLPFLQFGEGGVRVNFAGYHAEAGLGGLLGGANAGGGLRASAGTPSGAHASAGLGGILGGDNANTGGVLHAKAGLGNGGPEAAAGLGGVLDGGTRSVAGADGGLYAGATLGNAGAVRKEVYVQKQVPKVVYKEKEVIAAPSGSASLSGNINAAASSSSAFSNAGYVEKQGTPVQDNTPISAGAGLVGGIYGRVGSESGPTVYKSVEKVSVPVQKTVVIQKIAAPATATAVAAATANVQGELNTGVGAGGESNVVVDKVVYPARWHYRKRIHTRVHPYRHVQKTVIYNKAPIADAGAQGGASASAGLSGEIFTPSAVAANVGGGAHFNSGVYKSATLFDDIFNIPISALTAVNQLLNNKGR